MITTLVCNRRGFINVCIRLQVFDKTICLKYDKSLCEFFVILVQVVYERQ